MFFSRLLPADGKKMEAHVWAFSTYVNTMFCSKHILAEALFAKACLTEHPEITEVVCASRGNLSFSVARLALRHNVETTIFLPNYVSDRCIDLLLLMNATVKVENVNRLTEEVAPIARAYAQANPSRLFLDQFDLEWCSHVYSQTIFSEVSRLFPFEDHERQMCMVVPCGTGSLLIAAARFLDQLHGGGHRLIPVFLQEPDSIKQNFLDTCRQNFPRVEIQQSEVATQANILNALRKFSPPYEIPFGMTSAGCVAVALELQQKHPNQKIDIVPILTDAFLTTEIPF